MVQATPATPEFSLVHLILKGIRKLMRVTIPEVRVRVRVRVRTRLMRSIIPEVRVKHQALSIKRCLSELLTAPTRSSKIARFK